MIRHHVTLQRLAEELTELLEGARLTETWTQSKDVACFVFEHHDNVHYLECDIRPPAGTFFVRNSLRRANKNTIDLFHEAINQRVACVVKHSNDRVISIILETCQIHAELFSGGSGNIVLVHNGLVTDALHDKRNRLGKVFRTREITSSSLQTTQQQAAYRAMIAMFPTLGKWFAIEACNRLSIDPNTSFASLSELQTATLVAESQNVLSQAQCSRQWFVLSLGQDIVLAPLLLIHSIELARFDSVLSAIAKTLACRMQEAAFNEQRLQMIRALTQQKKKVQTTLHHLELDKQRDTRAHAYKRFGDLIMSAQNLQQRNCDSIDVVDWETGIPQTVSLNPDVSLLENAQRYYDKSRQSQRASIERDRRLPLLMEQLRMLEEYMQKVDTATTVNDLPLIPQSLIRMRASKETKTPDEEYRVFQLDDAHTLYVGKSAANNDQLTMKFAKQQDWWLHVRGASGSHAVLKGVTAGTIPKEILERAAAITAYYSQARNASYVPVVYTQRKYIRKPKGANIGAVTIEREQTIIVKPALPED